MTDLPRPPRLLVETREIDPVDDLLAFADPHSPLAWLRRSDGIIGLGGMVAGYRGRRLPDRNRSAHSAVARRDLAPPHSGGRDRRPRRTARDRARRVRRNGLRCAVALVQPSHRPPRHPRSAGRPGMDHPHPLGRHRRARTRPRSDPVRSLLVGDPRTRSPRSRGIPGRGPRRNRRDRRRRGRKGRARPRARSARCRRAPICAGSSAPSRPATPTRGPSPSTA